MCGIITGMKRWMLKGVWVAVAAILVSQPVAASGVYQLDSAGRKQAFKVPPRTVVLTFDDGPTPYTQEILEILRDKRVPATFFVVGRNALQLPILQDIVAQGHELGNHTYSHPNLAKLPQWRQRYEVAMGRVAIEAQTGRSPRLFRAPYQGADSGQQSGDGPLRAIASQGYVVAGEDVDTADWYLRYADEIRAKASGNLPGGVMLLHDGGGDRSRTVQALPGIIDDYRRAGFKFMTLGSAIGLSHEASMPRVQGGQAIAAAMANLVFSATRLLGGLAAAAAWLLIAAGLTRAAFLIVAAITQARRRRRNPLLVDVPCTVIIPAYNEAAGIQHCLRSVLASRYPRFEVIVVDDGSSDGTAGLALVVADQRVRVVEKPNGGKADALNYGIGLARTGTIVAIDADTVFRPDTLFHLCHHFSDPKVGAVSGNTKIANRRNLITRLQSLEYVVGFNLDRRMGDLFDCITVVPGAIGAFRKAVLQDVGGFRHDTLAEDTDLTLAIKERGYRIVYDDRSVAFTEAPGNVRDLVKQRFRWTFGTMQAVWKHRRVMLRPRYGTLGMIGLPYLLVFQIAIPLLGPVFDVVMLAGLAAGHGQLILACLVAYLLLDLAMAALALKLDGEKLGQTWLIVPQRVIYRPLMYYVLIKALLNVLKGNLVGWGTIKREGAALAKALN